jgi:proteasome lid subunit RPN8/RPN11
MLKLEIPKRIYKKMLEHAHAKTPIEACGILAGKNRKVEKFYPMTNIDNSSNHFMMDAKEQFSVVKDIRAADLEMLAIYHSHPGSPARLSVEDVKLALTPNVIYTIVSLQKPGSPVINGFLINDGISEKVPIEILENKE